MKQTTFSCPFSRSSPPLLFHCGLLQDPSRPEEKPQRISQTQDPRKAKVRLNLSPARGTEGRGARPDAPAARRRDGPRTNLPPRPASSLRRRAELQGCGAARTSPASTAALPLGGSPRRPPARGLGARLPTPRCLCGLWAAN